MYDHFNFQEGEILLINKPKFWTSFDVVKKIRVLIEKKYQYKLKVGHAGTLDPLATGLIIICTGKATKKIAEIQEGEKEYIATLKLGETTPSFDLETNVDHKYETGHITKSLVNDALQEFTGDLQQIPPAFSAVNIKGQRAYKKARKGEAPKMKPKRVFIRSTELISYNKPYIKIKIKCSKGTYIRALARDIGNKLKCGAHITELKRTAIGDYLIDKALGIKQFERLITLAQ